MSVNTYIKEQNFSKNNPKIMNAWAFYDWANSVYSLVITSTIFPIYYTILTTHFNKKVFVPEIGEEKEVPVRYLINIFGQNYEPDAILSFSYALSFLFVVLLSPFLSSLADTIGNKKSFLQFFCYLGATSCMGLAMFTGMDNIFLGLLFSTMASIGFWGSLVFYNSFLPDIATPDRQDALSAKGFIYGYVGSVILLIICLILIQGITADINIRKTLIRVSFLITGAWWFGFSQYCFKHLPQFGNIKNHLPKDLILLNYKNIFNNLKKDSGFIKVLVHNIRFYFDIANRSNKELIKVGRHLFQDRNLKYYLSSFFFYSVGMQTIFLMATPFGSTVVFPRENDKYKLIITILLIQIIAIFGAFIFSKLSKRIGNKNVINTAIIIWAGCCASAFMLNKENPNLQLQFYILAGFIGLVMGGLQAISRSTYSKLLPENSEENTIFFSFYDVLEKIAIVFGMLIFSGFIQKFGNMQYAFIAMSVFFILGLIFNILVKKKD